MTISVPELVGTVLGATPLTQTRILGTLVHLNQTPIITTTKDDKNFNTMVLKVDEVASSFKLNRLAVYYKAQQAWDKLHTLAKNYFGVYDYTNFGVKQVNQAHLRTSSQKDRVMHSVEAFDDLLRRKTVDKQHLSFVTFYLRFQVSKLEFKLDAVSVHSLSTTTVASLYGINGTMGLPGQIEGDRNTDSESMYCQVQNVEVNSYGKYEGEATIGSRDTTSQNMGMTLVFVRTKDQEAIPGGTENLGWQAWLGSKGATNKAALQFGEIYVHAQAIHKNFGVSSIRDRRINLFGLNVRGLKAFFDERLEQEHMYRHCLVDSQVEVDMCSLQVATESVQVVHEMMTSVETELTKAYAHGYADSSPVSVVEKEEYLPKFAKDRATARAFGAEGSLNVHFGLLDVYLIHEVTKLAAMVSVSRLNLSLVVEKMQDLVEEADHIARDQVVSFRACEVLRYNSHRWEKDVPALKARNEVEKTKRPVLAAFPPVGDAHAVQTSLHSRPPLVCTRRHGHLCLCDRVFQLDCVYPHEERVP